MNAISHLDFTINQPAARVRLAPGARREVRGELGRLGMKRALVLSTPGQSALALEIAAGLGDAAAGVFTRAQMHTPVAVTSEAMATVNVARADCLVSVGGGSAIGLGKAIACRTNLPQIALPTTYAGSEATAILGQTQDGIKTTLTDPKVRPEVVIYDPELIARLPSATTVTSAMNAMAHAVEALYAKDANPLSTAMAVEGLEAFITGLPEVVRNPADLDARGRTQYGAWLCGSVLGQVGMALHHKLCHTLGGALGLPHAATHAIILPHATAYNAAAAAEKLAPVSDLLGGGAPGRALYAFASEMGAPTALCTLGVDEADLDRVADLALTKPYWNPAPIKRNAIRALLQAAWSGEPPAAG